MHTYIHARTHIYIRRRGCALLLASSFPSSLASVPALRHLLHAPCRARTAQPSQPLPCPLRCAARHMHRAVPRPERLSSRSAHKNNAIINQSIVGNTPRRQRLLSPFPDPSLTLSATAAPLHTACITLTRRRFASSVTTARCMVYTCVDARGCVRGSAHAHAGQVTQRARQC